ncbi:MAG: O-antigen ligase family protein [Bacillota bacterium]|nr:O-antigen ligase family protein [Bacillota bacterium]
MQNEGGIVYNSVIIRFISVILGSLKTAYYESRTGLIVARSSKVLKTAFQNSIFWRAVRLGERSSEFWENSIIFKLLQGIGKGIVFVIRSIFSLLGTAYSESITGRIISAVTNNFALVFSFFIFMLTVVPYKVWHNQYGLIFGGLLLLLYLIKTGMDKGFGLDIKRVDFAFVLFMLATLLSVVTSIDIKGSSKSFLFEAVAFLFVFILANSIRTKRDLSIIIYGIIVGVTIASIYGLWQYANHIPIDPLWVDISYSPGVTRIYSTMGNPNNYAEYLILALPFYGAAFFNTRQKGWRALIVLLALLPLSNLLLTNSRGSWIAFVVLFMVYVFLKNRKLIPILLVIGIVMIPFIPASIIKRISTVGKDSSSELRLIIWKSSYKMLKDFWVTGIGKGSAPFISLFQHYNITITPPAHSHMLPLVIWLESGIAGILSFLWMLARIVKKGCISIFGKGDAYLNNVMMACIAALIGIIIVGMVEYVWFYERVMYMFWIVVAIFYIAVNIGKNSVQLKSIEN